MPPSRRAAPSKSSPLAPLGHRNGLKWRAGRPRWEPSPTHRAMGLKGLDLKTASGGWMNRGEALGAADARKLWADLVREAVKEDAVGGDARADLRQALEALERPTDTAARHQRGLVDDLIEAGRALLAGRDAEQGVRSSGAPRSVDAMIDGFFADPAACRKPATLKAYCGADGQGGAARRIRARFGRRPIADVTRGELRNWYIELVAATSASTANATLAALGAFYRWAGWNDWVAVSPVVKLGREAPPGRRVFWTTQEERSFVAWCDGNGFADVADGVVAGLWTGARISDICAATLDQLRGKTWRYVPIKTDKSGREAIASITEPLRLRVERRERQALTGAGRPYLLMPNGSPHDGASFYQRFVRAKELALAQEAVPDSFLGKRMQDTRDTCITRLAAAGVPFMKIWQWTGHSPASAEDILREHYIALLDEGAMETGRILQGWADENGLSLQA